MLRDPVRPVPRPRLVLVAMVFLLACEPPEYLRTSVKADSGPSDGVTSGGRGGNNGGGGSGTGGTMLIGTGGIGGSGGITSSGGAPAATGGRGTMGGGGGGTGAAGRGTGAAGVGGAGSGGRIGSGGSSATGGAGTGGTATGGAGTGGRGTGGAGTGGAGTGGAGTGGRGTGGAATVDNAGYNFETNAQSWAAAPDTPAFTSVTRSTAQKFAGQASLAGAITATAAGHYQLAVSPTPAVPAGATITFHVFVPAEASIDFVQPYALESVDPWMWFGTSVLTSTLTVGGWNTVAVMLPATAKTIGEIGIQFGVTAAWTGTVYIDSISW